EAGSAVIVTGMTLALGVAVWAFSILEFQATMGLMLSFMFVVNTVAAITVLPSLAVALDWFFPRRSVMRLTV
ncbi:MAG: MMPL family transporter, partial [Alphaproteobacteria bacterium]